MVDWWLFGGRLVVVWWLFGGCLNKVEMECGNGWLIGVDGR